MSASTVQRLTESWQAAHAIGKPGACQRSTTCTNERDGIGFNVRVPDRRWETRTGDALVIIGVRPDASKELVAVTDGYREST